MEIPLYIFLIIYLVAVGFVVAYSFFSLYHLFRFGDNSSKSFWASFIYLAVLILIFFISYKYISQIDWQEGSISLFNFQLN